MEVKVQNDQDRVNALVNELAETVSREADSALAYARNARGGKIDAQDMAVIGDRLQGVTTRLLAEADKNGSAQGATAQFLHNQGLVQQVLKAVAVKATEISENRYNDTINAQNRRAGLQQSEDNLRAKYEAELARLRSGR